MAVSHSSGTRVVKRYRSFTTASLLFTESLALSDLFRECHDWEAVRKQAVEGNLVQARTSGTKARIVGEVCSRLRLLSDRERDILIGGNRREQGYLLWLAVCRRYAMIRDFAVEVVQARYLSLRHVLTAEDFDSFYNRKADWHPELARMADNTRKRLRPALFLMMRQAGLLTGEMVLVPATLGPRLVDAIAATSREDLALFPTTEKG